MPGQQSPWLRLAADNDPVLYVNVLTAQEVAAETVEDKPPFKAASGVMINVSGRHPGDQPLRDLLCELLTTFDGVVFDDYSEHPWTLGEIESGALKHGHPFFDYVGWCR